MKIKALVLAVAAMLVISIKLASADHESTSNTFYGQGAGVSNAGENHDTFIGAVAGFSNTTGKNNTFLGNGTGLSNTTGTSNTFIGDVAGNSNTIGGYNTFIGQGTGFHSIGDNNTFLGVSAGGSNTTGASNTFLGHLAGYNNQIGNANVFLGHGAGYSERGSNKLYIDNCLGGAPCAFPLIYGEFDNRILKINGTLFETADERLKKNIEPLKSSLQKVMHLQGISYGWRAEENPGRGFTKDREIGLIAQDVEAVIPELVHTDSEGYKAIAYDKMVPVLIEAIKEQQGMISRLKKSLEAMEKILTAVEGSASLLRMPKP